MEDHPHHRAVHPDRRRDRARRRPCDRRRPDRIWDAAYEHYDIGAIFTFIKSTGIADLLASIGL
ncbi:MAG: hypothetical protein ACLUNO_04775 [Oscillospiraceae bacterium]